MSFSGEPKLLAILHGVAYNQRLLIGVDSDINGIQQDAAETLISLNKSVADQRCSSCSMEQKRGDIIGAGEATEKSEPKLAHRSDSHDMSGTSEEATDHLFKHFVLTNLLRLNESLTSMRWGTCSRQLKSCQILPNTETIARDTEHEKTKTFDH